MTTYRPIEIHVDQMVVELDLSDAQSERLTPVLRAAFEDVARRLQASPAGRWREPSQLALGQLRVESLGPDELLGPRGAAKLADAFWEQLIAPRNSR